MTFQIRFETQWTEIKKRGEVTSRLAYWQWFIGLYSE
jgi:hypothetical protein